MTRSWHVESQAMLPNSGSSFGVKKWSQLINMHSCIFMYSERENVVDGSVEKCSFISYYIQQLLNVTSTDQQKCVHVFNRRVRKRKSGVSKLQHESYRVPPGREMNDVAVVSCSVVVFGYISERSCASMLNAIQQQCLLQTAQSHCHDLFGMEPKLMNCFVCDTFFNSSKVQPRLESFYAVILGCVCFKIPNFTKR